MLRFPCLNLTSVKRGLIVDCSTAELRAAEGPDDGMDEGCCCCSIPSVRLRRFSLLRFSDVRVRCPLGACGEDSDLDDDELFFRPVSSTDRFFTGFPESGCVWFCPDSVDVRRFWLEEVWIWLEEGTPPPLGRSRFSIDREFRLFSTERGWKKMQLINLIFTPDQVATPHETSIMTYRFALLQILSYFSGTVKLCRKEQNETLKISSW